VHVFVRDWLSSNNVVLKSRDGRGHRLGLWPHAPLTLALLATERGLGDAPLAFLVNTALPLDHDRQRCNRATLRVPGRGARGRKRHS